MEQSRGSGWHRPTTPGGAPAHLGQGQTGETGHWAQGTSGSLPDAGATGQDSDRSSVGSGLWGLGGCNAGGRPALMGLTSPAPEAAEGPVGQLGCRFPGNTLVTGTGLSAAPAQAADRAQTFAGVRHWQSHGPISCSLQNGPEGVPTVSRLWRHVWLHDGPGLPGVRLLSRAGDCVLELGRPDKRRAHLPVRPAVRALLSQQHGDSAHQQLGQPDLHLQRRPPGHQHQGERDR